MMMIKEILLLFAVLLLVGCTTAEPPVRIVCIGDSLTACGGPDGRYTDWLAEWLPGCELINKGIGGNTLAQGRARYQRDVMELNPDVVVIALGANDFWRANRPIDELASDLEHMVEIARHAEMQVVVASCFGDPSPMIVDELRHRYGSGIAAFERQICERHNGFYVPNMQADIKPAAMHPECWGDDRHPNKTGNEKVARRILMELKKALVASR